ncbi:MAG: type II toxin-antitoxin system VapC family toxin [Prevotellaceae bacterium]|jgi:predicted nucleic acid-binding protein|nr:type II toxin-antitoxin system VapC family toxin [Prevotellaceae bacterium]
MKSKVYLDTSAISALFDMRSPERMEMTKAAWKQLKNYDVYISEIVMEELSRVTESLRKNMLESVENATVLPVTKAAQSLADAYVERGVFPEKYYDDALHVAIASIHQIGILLSWNFTHLVKLKTRRLVTLVNTIENYSPVEIISPPEL